MKTYRASITGVPKLGRDETSFGMIGRGSNADWIRAARHIAVKERACQPAPSSRRVSHTNHLYQAALPTGTVRDTRRIRAFAPYSLSDRGFGSAPLRAGRRLARFPQSVFSKVNL